MLSKQSEVTKKIPHVVLRIAAQAMKQEILHYWYKKSQKDSSILQIEKNNSKE
jgi:hypothetical protein